MSGEENFSDKYLKSNFLIKKLVGNFYDCVGEILDGIEVKTALEIGCGPGFSTQYLKGYLRNIRFEASELSEDLAVEARKRNPGIKIRQESIYELQRQDNSFDLVIALEVLEHLDKPESALKELCRVASKYILVSVPDEPLWRILNILRLKYLKNFGNTPGHLRHWSKNQFIKFIGSHFKAEKIKTSLPWIIILGKKL